MQFVIEDNISSSGLSTRFNSRPWSQNKYKADARESKTGIQNRLHTVTLTPIFAENFYMYYVYSLIRMF